MDTSENSSLELVNFITQELKSEISAIIPTHFHEDCIEGIEAFEKHDIPVYASNHTIELFKQDVQHFSKPIKEFVNELTLEIKRFMQDTLEQVILKTI